VVVPYKPAASRDHCRVIVRVRALVSVKNGQTVERNVIVRIYHIRIIG
jgi:hypothetical protein